MMLMMWLTILYEFPKSCTTQPAEIRTESSVFGVPDRPKVSGLWIGLMPDVFDVAQVSYVPDRFEVLALFDIPDLKMKRR